MKYLLAFLFSGLVCSLAQVLLDNTKLTPGHSTSIFTIIGSFLGFLGIYDKLIMKFGAGATVLISNFGYLLYSSGLQGFKDEGILGLFSSLLCKSSVAIVGSIVFSFVFALLFKPKD